MVIVREPGLATNIGRGVEQSTHVPTCFWRYLHGQLPMTDLVLPCRLDNKKCPLLGTERDVLSARGVG